MSKPATLHNKVERARQLLTETAIDLNAIKLASQLLHRPDGRDTPRRKE